MQVANRIQLRRDTSLNWTSADPILAQGELGIETNTLKIKIGDGLTHWALLPYYETGIGAAINVTYDNSVSGLTASDVQAAIDEVLGSIPVVPVTSVNTKTGDVVIDADDISDATTSNKFVTSSDKDKLSDLSGVNTGDQDLSGLLPNTHLNDFTHADISHTNRAALNAVSGTNTGDQDLSTLLPKTHLNDFTHADIAHANRTALDNVSGVNTGDQNLSGLLPTSHLTDFTHADIAHTNRSALNSVSGTNTGDETTSSVKTKLGAATSVIDGYLTAGDHLLFTNKQSALGFTPENAANKGANNGYAGLDSGGKIPVSALPSTLLIYKGLWNATTNTPTLSTPDLSKAGYVYQVSVGGTRFSLSFSPGDWAIYNDLGVIEKADNTDEVTSVNGQTGVVVLNADSISDAATTNKFVTAAEKTAISHTNRTALDSVTGVNTGDQDISNLLPNSHLSDFAHADISHTNRAALNAVSGTNTGDETNATIKTKLGAATSAVDGYLTSADHATFTAKQNALGFTAENSANKKTTLTDSDTDYPTTRTVNTALAQKVTTNTAITGETKTKVTYDNKGLVTGGADATTADIASSTDKRYVTDANLTVIGNTSGVNTGDQIISVTTDGVTITGNGLPGNPLVAVGGAAAKTWVTLINTWTAAPVSVSYSGGDGKVLEYTYGSTKYYRFIPTTYSSTTDAFYTTYANPTLSGLLAVRGVAI
jgi:hypothetical protein